jgi:hypothetical protein
LTRFVIPGGRRKMFIALLALASCHGACGNSSSTTTGDSGADAAVGIADASTLAPQRCTAIAHHASLGSPQTVGDAVATDDGFVIGLIREKNIFSIASVSADLSNISFSDIGPVRGDAAPPQPFLWDKSVYITWINSGELRIGRLEAGKVALIAEQFTDLANRLAKDPPLSDIPSFDVMAAGERGIIAWDFLDPLGGNIRVLNLSKDGVEAHDAGLAYLQISPSGTDADTPRLAPRKGGGYWAIWIARKVEPTSDASAIEGPGETPTTKWLEAAPLDDHGNRAGDVVHLTPSSGHIAGYDLLVTSDGVDVIARDATESSADDGTTLVRVRLSEKGTDKSGSVEIIADEIGRAVPDVVTTAMPSGSIAWAVVPDQNDATRIVPIRSLAGAAGARIESPSIEPLLRSSRALALRSAAQSANGGVELLAVRAASGSAPPDQAEITLVSCSR